MSNRVGDLLVKALDGLTREEQGELLAGLLVHRPPPDVPVPQRAEPSLEVLRVTRLQADAGPGTEGLKVLPVRLPVADYERLRAWSREHEFSMAIIVRTLVERFLDGQGVARRA